MTPDVRTLGSVQNFTPEGDRALDAISARHGLSRSAVDAMLMAVNNGGGTMAQFHVPELGGGGQWMRGGMTMVGNMFDNGLKYRVDTLCTELSDLLASTQVLPPASAAGNSPSNAWWPSELGSPSTSGGQNDARYAYFPNARRLAVESGGVVTVFDTLDHHIGGVSQQQGSGPSSLTFSSQYGQFGVTSLPVADAQSPGSAPSTSSPETVAPESNPVASSAPSASAGGDDIFAAIESLAGLHARGILTDDEFATKKAELLARL